MDPIMIPMTPYIHYTAGVYVGVTTPFLAITLACVIARLNPRIRPAWRFGWDDGLIIFGTILAVIIWAMLMSCVAYCAGSCPKAITLTKVIHIAWISTITIPIWGCAVAIIKISALCMLLRFQTGLKWKIFLYGMMAVQVIFALGNLIFVTAIFCRPFTAGFSMDPAERAKCVSAHTTRSVSNTATYLSLATDLILSLVPLTFLINLKRSIQERILICILMGAALLASAASVAKMMQIRSWDSAEGDAQIGQSSLIELWTVMEMFLGIIATCLPCFKAWVQGFLLRVGVMSEDSVPPVPYLRDITVTEHTSNGVVSSKDKTESNVQDLSPWIDDNTSSKTSHREKSIA